MELVICSTFRDLEEIMPNIAEQVVVEVAEGLETYGFKPLDATSGKLLKGQIMEIIKEGHKIRELIRKLIIVRCLEIPLVSSRSVTTNSGAVIL